MAKKNDEHIIVENAKTYRKKVAENYGENHYKVTDADKYIAELKGIYK